MADLTDTTRRILRNASEDDIMGIGARIAFYFALALFPAILALFALTGIVGGEQAFEFIMERLRQGMPGEAAEFMGGFVEEITGDSRPGMLSLGLLGVVWAASNGFNALAIGLNRIYDVESARAWWKRRLISIGMLIAAGIVLSVGTIAILAGPELAEAVGLGGGAAYLSWVLVFALIAGLLWVTYYILPHRDQENRKREVLIGAVVGAIVWIAASLLFRLYVANFGDYSATYGFVGAIIILLLWLYITALSILFGGEVAAALEETGERGREAGPEGRGRPAPA